MPDRPSPRLPVPVSAVSSPCIRQCCLDDNDVCLGCFRSLKEITAWGGASDGRRRRILQRAAQRKQQTSR